MMEDMGLFKYIGWEMDLGLKKIKPLVIKKNDINIAVYGIGYQKD